MSSELVLGRLKLTGRVILSPLERVSSVGFRAICFQQGAALTWTEMVRASSFRKACNSTFDLVDTIDPGTLTGVQFMATSAADLTGALHMLEDRAFSTHPHWQNIRAVDLNFGCPSPDIIKIGAGPALLKRRQKLGDILRALHSWKQTTKLDVQAVGAKIRLGLNKTEQQHKVYMNVVEAANETVDYLVVHARHGGQRSRDPPSWPAIGEIKARASIPIIGNGNVQSAADWRHMHEVSGCDGVMVGRAAMNNPWLFGHLVEGMADVAERASGIGTEPPWPTASQVDEATATFDAWSSKFVPKKRVLTWHAQNFQRLKDIAESGKVTKMIVPNTYHMLESPSKR